MKTGKKEEVRGNKSEAFRMPKTAKLLPCPFCGAKAKAKQQDPYPPGQPHEWWSIECSHGTSYHFARGNGCPGTPMAMADTIEEATARWNTRKAVR